MQLQNPKHSSFLIERDIVKSLLCAFEWGFDFGEEFPVCANFELVHEGEVVVEFSG